MPDREPRGHPVRRAASLLLRRLGNAEWDRVLRATAMIGLMGIPVVQLHPRGGPVDGAGDRHDVDAGSGVGPHPGRARAGADALRPRLSRAPGGGGGHGCKRLRRICVARAVPRGDGAVTHGTDPGLGPGLPGHAVVRAGADPGHRIHGAVADPRCRDQDDCGGRPLSSAPVCPRGYHREVSQDLDRRRPRRPVPHPRRAACRHGHRLRHWSLRACCSTGRGREGGRAGGHA